LKLVKMNIDEHPSIPGQMGIQSIPAVIAFVNGQPADGFLGALPESQVTAFIERLTKGRVSAEDKDLLEAANAALAEGNAAGAAELFARGLADDAGKVPAVAGPAPRHPRNRGGGQGEADARNDPRGQAERHGRGRGPRRNRARRAGEVRRTNR